MGNKQKIVFLSAILIMMMFFSRLNLFGSTLNVYDNAALFSASELEMLEKKAADLSEKLKLDIIILTVPDNQNKTLTDYVQGFYSQILLGDVVYEKTIFLIFDMGSGQLYLSGVDISVTNSGNPTFESTDIKTVGDISNKGSYYKVATVVLDEIENNAEEVLQTDSNTASEKDTDLGTDIIPYLALSIVLGCMVVWFMMPKMDDTYMNEVSTRLIMGNYLENNALNIIDKQDRHINTQLVCKD